MCANSKGSGKIVQMRRLARDFTGRLCDKYHNLLSWLKWYPQQLKHEVMSMWNMIQKLGNIFLQPNPCWQHFFDKTKHLNTFDKFLTAAIPASKNFVRTSIYAWMTFCWQLFWQTQTLRKAMAILCWESFTFDRTKLCWQLPLTGPYSAGSYFW